MLRDMRERADQAHVRLQQQDQQLAELRAALQDAELHAAQVRSHVARSQL